jgi:hypothetical protein
MPASAMDVRLREPSGVDLLFHNLGSIPDA